MATLATILAVSCSGPTASHEVPPGSSADSSGSDSSGSGSSGSDLSGPDSGAATVPGSSLSHPGLEAPPEPLTKGQWKNAEWTACTQGLDWTSPPTENLVTTPLAGRTEELLVQARAQLLRNRPWPALKASVLAVRSDSANPNCLDVLAEILIRLDRDGEAVRALEGAISIEPAANRRLRLAQFHAGQGRRAEAIHLARLNLETEADHPATHRALALWLYYDEEPDLAAQHARRARDLGASPPPQFWPLLERALKEKP